MWSKELLGLRSLENQGEKKEGSEMQGMLLGLEVIDKEEGHMRKAIIFSISTIF